MQEGHHPAAVHEPAVRQPDIRRLPPRANAGGITRGYRSGDFSDLLQQNEWSIELQLDVNIAALSKLDPSGTPVAEIANSKLVWTALQGLTPSLAYEEGIWVRLTHVECLGYARARWLSVNASDEVVAKDVIKHFFADTLTKRRDDNAICRLWWNAYIANLAMPGPELTALDLILKRADIRSNFVERSLTISRATLAASIVRIMREESWVTDREDNYRAFTVVVNRLGGGLVFEAMSDSDVDNFVRDCALRAGMPPRQPSSGAPT
jgi:hypothetical protein